MSELPDTVEITTGPDPRAAIVWLHGLGADGHDFEPIVPELRCPVATRFVFPHAPVRPVTINGGMAMRAWYDILSFDRSGPEDHGGIEHSATVARALLDREIERGIEPRHCVLAGFSQGGAIALHAGLRYPQALAGIMALSTYLPLHRLFGDTRSTTGLANKDVPILMAHGTADPVLPMTLGENSRDLLLQAGYAVEWVSYPMAHGVCPQEINDISRWLNQVLAI